MENFDIDKFLEGELHRATLRQPVEGMGAFRAGRMVLNNADRNNTQTQQRTLFIPVERIMR